MMIEVNAEALLKLTFISGLAIGFLLAQSLYIIRLSKLKGFINEI